MTQPLRTGNRLGKYRLERKLGEGGSAVVWQARDTVEGRRVAIKVVLDSVITEWGRAAVEGEARVAAQLDHPRIAGIRNADWIDSHFVMVTDIARKSLDEYPGARRSPDLALSILSDVAEGLAYAHERGLLHRDIKPANIFLYESRRAKLGDFGTARLAPAATRVLTEVGTFGYMAPEQAYGRPRFASDVFSLALTAYELWAGALPGWPFEWPLEGAQRFMLRCPVRVQPVIRRALTLDLRKRWSDGGRVPRGAHEGDRIDRLRPRTLEEERDHRPHDPQDRAAARSLRARDRMVPQALRARAAGVLRLPCLRRTDLGIDESLPLVRDDAQFLRPASRAFRSCARAASAASGRSGARVRPAAAAASRATANRSRAGPRRNATVGARVAARRSIVSCAIARPASRRSRGRGRSRGSSPASAVAGRWRAAGGSVPGAGRRTPPPCRSRSADVGARRGKT